MDREKLKETIQSCLSGGVVKTWSFMPNLIKAIMDLSEQDRQSLYELLVDEMPKEKDVNWEIDYIAKDGKRIKSMSIQEKQIYNKLRTDCLAVIKRVLIGGE